MLREPEFELETELEQALEEEFETGLESEDEATELEPLFAGRLGTGQAYTAEEREQGVPCPTPQSVTVSGFPRYSFSIASLPANEQSKIRNIADLIAKSFQKGCQPFLRVRLTGHADKDLDRERREPGFMMRVSRSRSAAVILELERLIKSRGITPWRIAWDRRGVGASSLVVQNPTTERERTLNRRVVIEVSPSCTCTDFFEEYDRRFLPSDVNANPTMTPKERADRSADVLTMGLLLWWRAGTPELPLPSKEVCLRPLQQVALLPQLREGWRLPRSSSSVSACRTVPEESVLPISSVALRHSPMASYVWGTMDCGSPMEVFTSSSLSSPSCA